MRKVDYRKQIDLFDTFIKLMGTPKEIEIRWSRRQHHPRIRAYMIGMLFQLAKEHQNKYTMCYQYFQIPHMHPNICFRAQKLFQEPLTGGMRPQKPRRSKDPRKDVVSQLVRLNLQRTLHELCCGKEEGIVPLPNFIKKLKEKEKWMACRRETPLNIDEALRSSAPSSPVKGPGSAH